ncbi:MAG: YdcF family protein [Clostridiales bacterium]|jgi:uncharacterized SAM-binding protein YcdF (DUF218 family)|nr:YdcF family protein [Clostridiales bacterium]
MKKIDMLIKAISNFIFVENAPQKSDVIFLPGSDHASLPEKAAELYREGYAPLLLPSGRYYINHGKFAGVRDKPGAYTGAYETECDFFTDVLLQNGVPWDAILQEDEATYTKENAVFSRKITDGLGLKIKRAIICCKPFHARRCLMYYQLSYPKTKLLIVPAPSFDVDKTNWHTTPFGIDRVMGELTRCGGQFAAEFKACYK